MNQKIIITDEVKGEKMSLQTEYERIRDITMVAQAEASIQDYMNAVKSKMDSLKAIQTKLSLQSEKDEVGIKIASCKTIITNVSKDL